MNGDLVRIKQHIQIFLGVSEKRMPISREEWIELSKFSYKMTGIVRYNYNLVKVMKNISIFISTFQDEYRENIFQSYLRS